MPTEVCMRALDDIWPCPDNERLYRPVDPSDPDVRALAESIRENGVREPLVVYEDRGIIILGPPARRSAEQGFPHRASGPGAGR